MSALRIAAAVVLVVALQGCAVFAVADAVITVGATAVKAGAVVAGAAVDVVGAGIEAATSDDEDEKAQHAKEGSERRE
ncbi:hypothetical protein [Azoarcus olearius]|uniref:hypothetical protein n=1 Tax=Azoarcus sp. (strain BH72) TaxID=418699 RepID=UPI0002E847D5|nr:hypothetical protein [Azoarcus olearius]